MTIEIIIFTILSSLTINFFYNKYLYNKQVSIFLNNLQKLRNVIFKEIYKAKNTNEITKAENNLKVLDSHHKNISSLIVLLPKEKAISLMNRYNNHQELLVPVSLIPKMIR